MRRWEKPQTKEKKERKKTEKEDAEEKKKNEKNEKEKQIGIDSEWKKDAIEKHPLRQLLSEVQKMKCELKANEMTWRTLKKAHTKTKWKSGMKWLMKVLATRQCGCGEKRQRMWKRKGDESENWMGHVHCVKESRYSLCERHAAAKKLTELLLKERRRSI